MYFEKNGRGYQERERGSKRKGKILREMEGVPFELLRRHFILLECKQVNKTFAKDLVAGRVLL